MAVKVAVIGAGKIAERLALPNLAKCADATVAALVDINKELALSIADKFSLPKSVVSTDWEETVKRKDIDAVIICLPNYLHAPVSIAASNNKKHVLVEKPVTITMNDAQNMIDAAAKNKVVLMVEQTQRFDPIHEAAKKVIESGKLGKINAIRGRIGHAGPKYWSSTSTWFNDKKLSGGGAMIDIGVHILDLLRWLSGKEIAEVSAIIENVEKGYKLDDNAVVAMKFTDGAIGSFEVSWTTRPYEVTTAFYGEYGKMTTALGREKPVIVTMGRREPEDPNGTLEEIYPEVAKESKNISPVHYFMRCVTKNEKPFISGEEGAKTLEIILAAYKSAETKSRVILPLKERAKSDCSCASAL